MISSSTRNACSYSNRSSRSSRGSRINERDVASCTSSSSESSPTDTSLTTVPFVDYNGDNSSNGSCTDDPIGISVGSSVVSCSDSDSELGSDHVASNSINSLNQREEMYTEGTGLYHHCYYRLLPKRKVLESPREPTSPDAERNELKLISVEVDMRKEEQNKADNDADDDNSDTEQKEQHQEKQEEIAIDNNAERKEEQSVVETRNNKWHLCYEQLYNFHVQKQKQLEQIRAQNQCCSKNDATNQHPQRHQQSQGKAEAQTQVEIIKLSRIIPQNYPKLNTWIKNQRKYIAMWEEGQPSPLSHERIDKLNDIDFYNLYSTKFDMEWNETFEELYYFYITRGHLRVEETCCSASSSSDSSSINNIKNSITTNCEKGRDHTSGSDSDSTSDDDHSRNYKRLAQWMVHQRQQYAKFQSMMSDMNTTTSNSSTITNINTKEVRSSSMTNYRIQKLESIGFIWDSRSDHVFESKLKLLREYKRIHGHLRIPKSNPQLGRWVARQRSLYRSISATKDINGHRKNKRKRNSVGNNKNSPGDNKRETSSESSLPSTPDSLTLTGERIRQLNEIGFEWISTVKGTAYNNTWEKRYDDLCSYRDKHGNCNVPKNYPYDRALGVWVRNQRSQYWSMKKGKKSPMTLKRVGLLEGAGFQWKLRK